MEGPSKVISDALVSGITKGRGGKGSIFVFATGNGGEYGDNCNFDGYANSIYTVSIGAIDRYDDRPFYSEQCSAQLAVTYSSSTEGDGIYTTDVGKEACTDSHGGTSAAAPLAAGLFALVLSIRPDLHWRDIQHLAVRTAQPFSLDDPDWQPTTSGRKFNHKYGYGKLDAYRIVEESKTYNSIGPQVQLCSGSLEVNQRIPSSSTGIKQEFVMSAEVARKNFLNLLEHVTVTLNIEHQRRGDIEVYLISPNNVTSILSPGRQFDESEEGFENWTFMSVKHWDESIVGTWTLLIVDDQNLDKVGTLQSWSLSFYGARYDPVMERSEDIETHGAARNPNLTSKSQQPIISSMYPIIAVFGAATLIVVASAYRLHRVNTQTAGDYSKLQDTEQETSFTQSLLNTTESSKSTDLTQGTENDGDIE
ncbi:pheromone processing endoprotease [Basidiobolus ranarum]|uniref:Pheromone processing endoprotease n=1 Tax=Basidiobolus ranarum TaxID=34480 RepID=A0ABR2WEW2_9FUNG